MLLILGILRVHCCRNMLPHDLKICHTFSYLSDPENLLEQEALFKSKYTIWISVNSCVKGHFVSQSCHQLRTHKLLGPGEVNGLACCT